MAALACWSGGLWSDAELASDEDRISASRERCRELVRRVYGADDEDGYERLRSLEALSVADLRRKIDAVPVDDAVSARRRDQLDAFFDATVEAAREAMLGSVTIAIRTTTCLS